MWKKAKKQQLFLGGKELCPIDINLFSLQKTLKYIQKLIKYEVIKVQFIYEMQHFIH